MKKRKLKLKKEVKELIIDELITATGIVVFATLVYLISIIF